MKKKTLNQIRIETKCGNKIHFALKAFNPILIKREWWFYYLTEISPLTWFFPDIPKITKLKKLVSNGPVKTL